jgi:hypothetical protein
MLKEKHIVFFVLGGALINVMVLATVVLIGQRQDARLMFQKFLHGIPEG